MKTNQQLNFYTGTSGLVLPVPNKLFFPIEFQDKSRLVYYASLFNSLEVNSSFYKVPLANTVKRWAGEVPDNFRFTFKLWKGITHNKGLVFNELKVEQFMKIVGQADKKIGCLLIQLPPSTTLLNYSQLEKLLLTIQKFNSAKWKMAVEFRHNSWYQQKTYDLLNNCKATIVLHDMPASKMPSLQTKSGFVYIRFHGIKGDYKGSYANDFLQEYANCIKIWQQEQKTVYAYFNNTIGDAVENLNTLNSFVNA